MSRKGVLAVALLAGISSVLFWERGESARLGRQNESLRAEKKEADRLAAENRELPKFRAATTTPGSRDDIAELLRLRNEVHQVRAQKQDVDRLRAENQRLADDLQSGKITPRKLSDLDGYVGRESWANAGLATPEASVQTFVWSLSTSNIEQFLHCVTPEVARQFERERREEPGRFYENFSGLNLFRNVTGFRVAERKTLAEDKVQIGIQVVANGHVLPLPVRRVGDEWKLDY